MPEPLHWSLGFFKARGYTVAVFCPHTHGADIDLGIAVEVFGPDFTDLNSPAFLSRFRCRVCGERGAKVILSPPSGY